MAEFSNVLRLIASVSNYENSSCSLGMSEKALTEFFRNVFKDEETYEEFYKQGCREMSEELFEYLKIHTDVVEFSEDAEDYIYGIINKANPYLSVSDNFQYVVTEMLHDACGYVGRNLNDSEFEDFHEYMDTNVSVGRYIEIMVGKKLGRPFDENNDIINDYAIRKGISYTIFYPKKENTNVDNTTDVDNTDVAVVNRKAKDVCAINIERTYEELTYAILNTSNYDGGIGATIVKCYTPTALEDYGFDNAECADISMLKVGELYTSTNYGSGVVVVRMS